MYILLADDHNLVRDGLKPFLLELAADVTVLEAADLKSALGTAEDAGRLDLIILDLKMPGMHGIAGIKAMRATRPDTPLVILSGHMERDEVLAAFKAGARGYIPKTVSGMALVDALTLVLGGQTYLPRDILARQEPAPPAPLATLSAREREILGHLVEGDTNKEIAARLGLQEITIKIHLRNVYRKIGASNRAQAVRIALSAGREGRG